LDEGIAVFPALPVLMIFDAEYDPMRLAHAQWALGGSPLVDPTTSCWATGMAHIPTPELIIEAPGSPLA
jgi:hypothetical protein